MSIPRQWAIHLATHRPRPGHVVAFSPAGTARAWTRCHWSRARR